MNDQSNVNYDVGNGTIYKIEILKSNLYDYNDDYILVRCDIIIIGHNIATEVALKNYASFIKCITKIDGTTIDDAEMQLKLFWNNR